MKLEGLLPLGSLVLLENSNKRLMVIGFLQQDSESNKVWDYVGIPFPEGYMGSNRTYLFNHAQIKRVFFIGYQDEEQFAFSAHLDQAVAELRAAQQKEGE